MFLGFPRFHPGKFMKNVGNQCILNDSGLPALSMDSIGNDDDDGDSLITIDIHGSPYKPSTDTQRYPGSSMHTIHCLAWRSHGDIHGYQIFGNEWGMLLSRVFSNRKFACACHLIGLSQAPQQGDQEQCFLGRIAY